MGRSIVHENEKSEIYLRGPNLDAKFRNTNFFMPSDPPTHPQGSTCRGLLPRSNDLVG